MNREPLVSVIVPIYNAAEYLERCINSVLGQEYKNFELILVNDGSQDASGEICRAYAAQDERVKVLEKENSGVSDSRNRAMDMAEGEYLQFLDADDWLTPDATKLFVQSAVNNDCDMVIADFYRVSGEKVSHKGDIEKEGILSREEFANYMMENPADFYYGVLWNKLFRRDLVEKHGLRMDPEISWCEDFIFNLEYIRHCRTIYALQVPVYYYVKTKGSLVNSQGASINNTIRMKLNVFEYYHQFLRELYDEEDYENIRFQVHRFFLTYAKDGFVPPVMLPGSIKLGQERQSACIREAVEGDGVPLKLYRCRKLWERYLEVIALKNSITVEEVIVLWYLNQELKVEDTQQLADLTGMTRRNAGSATARLERRGLVKRSAIKREIAGKPGKTEGKRKYQLRVLEAAEGVIQDLKQAEKDFETVYFRGFSEKEKEEYMHLAGRTGENLKDVLRV